MMHEEKTVSKVYMSWFKAAIIDFFWPLGGDATACKH